MRARNLRAISTATFSARAETGEPSVGTRMWRYIRLLLAADQHGDLGVREHLLGLAAEQQAREPPAAVRSHHHQVALLRLGGVDDGAPRLAAHDCGPVAL